jgi:hypothetical protein
VDGGGGLCEIVTDGTEAGGWLGRWRFKTESIDKVELQVILTLK